MRHIDAFRRAQGDPHGVERERVLFTRKLEFGERAVIGHEIFGMDLEPRGLRACRQHQSMVRHPQPDPGLRRDRVCCRAFAHYIFVRLPPASLAQTPEGSDTNEALSISLVAWPAQECVPAAQSFLPALATPKHFSMAGLSHFFASSAKKALLTRASAAAPNIAEKVRLFNEVADMMYSDGWLLTFMPWRPAAGGPGHDYPYIVAGRWRLQHQLL